MFVISLALCFAIASRVQESTHAQCERGELKGSIQNVVAQFDAGSELLLMLYAIDNEGHNPRVAEFPFRLPIMASQPELSRRIEGLLSVNQYDDGALYNRAVIQWVAGQHRSAIDSLKTVHDLVPEDPIYAITLAECQDAVGDLAGASNTIKDLLSAYPWLSFSKWFYQFDAQHRGIGTILLRAVLDSAHGSDASHNSMVRGWIYLRLGSPDLAYAEFAKATRLQSLGRAWLGLAITLMSKGDLPSSRMAVARAGYLGAFWSDPHDISLYSSRAALIYRLPSIHNRQTLILVDATTLLKPSLPIEKVANLE